MEWLGDAEAVGRLLVTAFLAVVFVQSATDKLLDRQGNLAYIGDVFKDSPIPAELVPLLLSALTFLEAAAGGLCTLGLLTGSFRDEGMGLASAGIAVSGLALVGLVAGQRLAKDYAGAAVIAAYFAVVLIGLDLF